MEAYHCVSVSSKGSYRPWQRYCSPIVSFKIDKELLALAGAPLVDGLFVSFISGNLLQHPGDAISFGIIAFSGGGCVGHAILQEDRPLSSIKHMAFAYLLILLGGLWIGMLAPYLISSAPINLHVLTAIFLISFGVKCLDNDKVFHFWGIDPQSSIRILCLTYLASMLCCGHAVMFSVDYVLSCNIFLAVVAGFLFTSVGTFVRFIFRKCSSLIYVRRGQAISLIAMGLNLLLPVLPTWLLIMPLVFGVLLDFWLTEATNVSY